MYRYTALDWLDRFQQMPPIGPPPPATAKPKDQAAYKDKRARRVDLILFVANSMQVHIPEHAAQLRHLREQIISSQDVSAQQLAQLRTLAELLPEPKSNVRTISVPGIDFTPFAYQP